MDILTQTLSNTTDSILIREILKVFSEVKCGNKTGNLVQSLSQGVMRLVVIFLIHYHFKKPENVSGILRIIWDNLVYRDSIFDISEISEEFCIAKRLKQAVKKNTSFEVFYQEVGDQAIFSMIPIIHRKLYLEAQELGRKDYQTHLRKQSEGLTLCNTLDGKFEPKTLFPSKNYTRLVEILQNHFEFSKLTKSFRTLGILLDGEPGLGKTDSLDFLATSRVCGEVLKIDMTKILDKDFSTIVSSAFSGRKSEELVILFDELDKYIDYQVRKAYRAHCTEREEKKAQPISSEEFVVHFKQDFLYELLSLLETTYHTHGLVILFCSNNFDTIFDGVEITHFQSLKKRFLRITFERCNAEELKDYLRYLNDKFCDTKWYLEEDDLERELNLIRSDLLIPYRQLCHLHIMSCYNIRSFITALNEWKNEEILEPDVAQHPGSFPKNLGAIDGLTENFALKSLDKGSSESSILPTDPHVNHIEAKTRREKFDDEGEIEDEEFDDKFEEFDDEFEDVKELKPVTFEMGEPTLFQAEDPINTFKLHFLKGIRGLLDKHKQSKGIEASTLSILRLFKFIIDNEKGATEILETEKGFREAVKEKMVEFENESKFPEHLREERNRVYHILRQRYPYLCSS